MSSTLPVDFRKSDSNLEALKRLGWPWLGRAKEIPAKAK
jgi:hypothetical protein